MCGTAADFSEVAGRPGIPAGGGRDGAAGRLRRAVRAAGCEAGMPAVGYGVTGCAGTG